MPSPSGEGQTVLPKNRLHLGEVHPTRDHFSSLKLARKYKRDYPINENN